MAGAQRASAQALYAASGSNGVPGQLHILNPANGSTISTVGALQDAAGAPYGLTGMAFHPTTGVLYGSVANFSFTNPGFLVTVNPATGLVTPVGDFSGITSTMADITFASDGTLYGWESGSTHSLHSINPATGATVAIGAPQGAGVFGGGGLAARWSDNTLFSTPDGSQGRTLRSVDRNTGVHTNLGQFGPVPLDFDASVAMDFNNAGTLFALLSDRGGVASSHLVNINQATAAVTDLGLTTLTDLDALAFQRVVPEPTSLGLIGLGAALLVARRRRVA